MRNDARLVELAKAFAPYATLYAVGGCVRDSLLNLDCYDIDVCSQLTLDDVKRALSSTDFVISNKSLRMGTIIISKGDFKVEYTTFRKESYDRASGNHSPNDVEFTTDMLLDAKRRDFSVNAIYWDVANDKCVDLLGGVKDLNNKILRTVDAPQTVFEADGLRILRLVRFACELGFDIEEQTFEVAKQNAWRVKDIAIEKVRDELCKIFVADDKHPTLNLKGAHLKGVELLDKLGLLDMFLPKVVALKGLEQPPQYHLYDAYVHTLKAFEATRCDLQLRWAALLHDVGKAVCFEKNGNFHKHEIVGEQMCVQILEGLKFSKADVREISSLVRWHMLDLRGDMSKNKLRKFVLEHQQIVDKLIELKIADGYATCLSSVGPRLSAIWQQMKVDGTPLSIKELCVDGKDLIELGVEEQYRAKILYELWIETAYNLDLRDRQKALKYIEKKKGKL